MHHKHHKRHPGISLFISSLVMASLFLLPLSLASAQQSNGNSHALQQDFENAAQEFHVPLNVLLSVAYNESRWDQHDGLPSTSGAYGIMALTHLDYLPGTNARGEDSASSAQRMSVADNPAYHTLDRAAQLLGVNPNALKHSSTQNIRGGAALLAEYEKQLVGSTPSNPAQWYGAVIKYSGSENYNAATSFASDVYATIRQGESRTLPNGQEVELRSSNVQPDTSTSATRNMKRDKSSEADCPNGLDCRYVQAADGTYRPANRPDDGLKINYIVIHDMEGYYQGSINYFATPGTCCSSNYLIRSSDGQITQMVQNKDISYQAGNYYINLHSIGIEHEGFAIEGSSWYTEKMYKASAKLVKYLAQKYGVPLDRAHIIGHDNVPGPTTSYQAGMHWDPGPYWDWNHYMALLGAPITPTGNAHSRIVTIKPNFQKNEPPVSYCFEDGCRDVPPRASSFVPLYTAPSFDAPLISDPYLHDDGSPGTTLANDWGDKAVAGQDYYVADQQGDWTAIYYAGQKAWFYNPHNENTVFTSAQLVTTKPGADLIPIFGRAYPESSGTVYALYKYSLPAGQYYPVTDLVYADYFPDGTYVQGDDQYYQISYNHRIVFVRKSDVQVVSGG